MRKKVGFTLIELLAVMIILGIIFLIAYPVVLNLIKEARIKSAIQSAYGYIEAVNIEVSVRKLETNKILDNTYNILETDLNVKHKGTTPSHGLLTILNGRVNNADLCINSYPIEYRNGVAVYNKENAICPVEYKFIEPEGTIIADLCNGGEYSADVNYKIKTVEDLVCLEKIVNDDNNNITFENNTIMLLSDLDIEDKKTYKAANALASYDINENGTIESIYTELTTDKGFNPIGSSSTPFKGTFEGYGFTISNLYINRTTNNTGLIGYMSAGSVTGLNLENVNVTGAQYTGGVVGYSAAGTTINEISISGNITGTSNVGGIAGYFYESSNTLKSVIVNADVTGTNNVGGIVGKAYATTIVKGVVESGTITATSGVLVGNVSGYRGTVTAYVSDAVEVTTSSNSEKRNGTSYSSSYTNDKHSIGMYDEVLDTWIGGDNDSSGYYIDYDSNGKLKVYSIERNPMIFDLKGEGTSESPYIINSVSDWKQAVLKNKSGYYFKLNADLDFNNKEFYPMGTNGNYFNGYLYGNAYMISNLDIKGVNNVGLIGYMSAGEVAGLNVENINITGTSYMGGVVGYLNDGTIKEVSLSGNIIGRSYLGGVAGYSKTSSAKIESVILNSIVIEGDTGAIGGVLGTRASTIPVTAVVDDGSLSTNTGVLGKIVGGSSNTFTGTSYASDSITVTRNNTGGDGTLYPSNHTNNKHSIGMYDEVLDTWIGGDNDSSGYYIDYDSNRKFIIYSTERNPMTFNLNGEGTSESPYIINSVSDWKQAVLKNKSGYYFKLNADLNFENQEFYPMGTTVNHFNGYLYGNAYTISNLDIKGVNNVGLIGYMSAGEVAGLNVENINITGTSYMGGVVGYLNDGTIKEVSLSGNIIGRSYLGGVAGYSKTSTAKIESVLLSSIIIEGETGAIGGVLGNRASTIPVTAVVESGTLSTNTGYLGKIVGGASNTFTGTSYASDSITVTRNYKAGDGTSFSSEYVNNLDYYTTNFSTVIDLTDSDSNGTLFGYKSINGVNQIRVIKAS